MHFCQVLSYPVESASERRILLDRLTQTIDRSTQAVKITFQSPAEIARGQSIFVRNPESDHGSGFGAFPLISRLCENLTLKRVRFAYMGDRPRESPKTVARDFLVS